MWIFHNRMVPFKGFDAVNVFGMLLVRPGLEPDEELINHEAIHTRQMREMLYVGFYVWYFVEWVVRLFMKGNAYRNIGFEREAYLHQDDLHYLQHRKHYAWFKLLRKKKKK